MALFDRVRGFLGARDTVKPTREQGTAGFAVYGGYIVKPEQNTDLLGQNRFRTAADLIANISIIGASLRYTLNLISRPKWKFDPPDDSAEAKAVAEFYDDVFENIDSGWTRIVRRSGMYRFHGFGVNEWVAKKREDGKIGFASIESRPQHTIEKWDIDDNGGILGVMQRDPQDGHERYLPRGKLLYLVDDTLTDAPDGMGWFRHLAEPARRLKSYLEIEGFGFERDLSGIPVGRMPLQEIEDLIAEGKLSREDATRMRQNMIDFVSMRRKKSDTGIVVDSKTYVGKTEAGMTVSGAPMWGIDLITGSQNSIEELGKAVERLEFEMALIMGTESMLIGRGGQGSRALSEDKSRNLALTANGTLADMAEAVNVDLIPVIGKLNGIPEKLWPRANVEDVAFKDAESIAKTLAEMATAGAVLAPDDPAINDLRDLMGISHAEPMDVGMINALQGKPDPTKPSPDAVLAGERAKEIAAQKPANDPGQPPGAPGAQPAAKPAAPARKAEPRTLYVQRRLLNSAELVKWAKGAGFTTTVPAEELHVTVCFSKRPLDWMAVSENWTGDNDGRLRVAPGGARLLEQFNGGAVVLLFKDDGLEWRHEQFLTAGASFDYPKYQPHVTITFEAPEGLDISKIEPYQGVLIFGPEIFEELNPDWKEGITEKRYNPSQPRDPGGPGGGQWIAGPAAGEPTNEADRGEVRHLDKAKKKELTEGLKGKTIDELHADAVVNQAELGKLGEGLQKELGLKFINPGVKALDTARGKVGRDNLDGPHQITDLARATFVVNSRAEADRVVSQIAKDSVVYDKGWQTLGGTHYLDRKLLVQYDNGGLAEIQLVPAGVQQQKDGRGHELYNMTREPSTPRGQAILLTQMQSALYTKAVKGTDFEAVFAPGD